MILFTLLEMILYLLFGLVIGNTFIILFIFLINYSYYYYSSLYQSLTNKINRYKYEPFLNHIVVITQKNNYELEGKLIEIYEFYDYFSHIKYLILTLKLQKRALEYKIYPFSIKDIHISGVENDKKMLDLVSEESKLFKKIDFYIEKHIKDFLYIDNND